MSVRKKIVRNELGHIVEAVRYGNADGSWDKDCITRVAAFVLGFDPDTNTSFENERMLDVVRPILQGFDPVNGVAPIAVVDGTGGIFRMELGDWVVKGSNTSFLFVSDWVFQQGFQSATTEFDELANLIYDNFPWEGQTYEAVAEKAASAIINAGWTKKENT